MTNFADKIHTKPQVQMKHFTKQTLFLASALAMAFDSHVAYAGYDYTQNLDRFTNKNIVRYNLNTDSECMLRKTIKSSIKYCKFLHISNESRTPSIMLYTISDGWEILPYKLGWPNKDGSALVIIRYKDGSSKRINLPTSYNGEIIRGGIVQERIAIELGSIKAQIPLIDFFEVQYGSNEYYFKLDNALTKKALNFENF